MNPLLTTIKQQVYDKCRFRLENHVICNESKEYSACYFDVIDMLGDNSKKRTVISRNAKITPKKQGLFVTFWHRGGQQGITIPYSETDDFDLLVINVQQESKIGQFVFPKSALINHGIISTNNSSINNITKTKIDQKGKRGFRVYPSWVGTSSKQAQKTQKWQLLYFYEVNKKLNLKEVANLYKAA